MAVHHECTSWDTSNHRTVKDETAGSEVEPHLPGIEVFGVLKDINDARAHQSGQGRPKKVGDMLGVDSFLFAAKIEIPATIRKSNCT